MSRQAWIALLFFALVAGAGAFATLSHSGAEKCNFPSEVTGAQAFIDHIGGSIECTERVPTHMVSNANVVSAATFRVSGDKGDAVVQVEQAMGLTQVWSYTLHFGDGTALEAHVTVPLSAK